MHRKKLVLCGVNYGKSYVPGVRASRELELAAILARGSERSRAFAETLGVPLHVDLATLPADIEMACVAVGEAGGALSRRLLERGIHVLAEHPMVPSDVAACIEAARETARVFHVNAHWADLPEARAFITAFRRLSADVPPLYVTAAVTPRTLYSKLDLLGRAIGSVALGPSEPGYTSTPGTHCSALSLELGGIPTILVAQTLVSTMDDGSDVFFDSASAAFRAGALTLLDFSGPVIWSPVLPRDSDDPTWSMLGSPTAPTPKLRRTARARANAEAVYRFVAETRGGPTPFEQSPGYLLDLSTTFATLCARFGRLEELAPASRA